MIVNILQSVMDGALMGCIYALIALGLSLIFGVLNVVNFAHGDFVMLSMYLTFWAGTYLSLDAVLTPLLTIPVLFGLGLLIYYSIIQKTLRERFVVQVAVTVGLMTFLRALAQLVWEARPRALQFSIIQGNFPLGPFTILLSRLISASVSVVAVVAVALFLKYSWLGRSIRAASDDADAASLMGVNIRWTYAFAFAMGSALTALAGGLLMSFQQVDPTMGLRFGLLSWCILALSGLGSISGLLISGVIVGVAEALTVAYWEPRARSLIVYLIFVVILWLRPRGLFGRK
jgi:branched-chain amino acid transport system permease protein